MRTEVRLATPPGPARHAWSTEEDRVVAWCVSALKRRRYLTLYQAADDCLKRLGALHQRNTDAEWAKSLPTPRAVVVRLAEHRPMLGPNRRHAHWSRVEMETLERFARALVQGQYTDTTEASTGCLHALAQLRQQHQPDASSASISPSAVYLKVDELARKLGKPMMMVPWFAEEDRVVDRFARALAAGRYQDVLNAARACLPALNRRSAGSVPPRRLDSVRHRVRQRLRILGLAWAGATLTDEEERIVSSHVRALVQGRYHDASRAAEACMAALARMANPAPRARPLSFIAVRSRIYSRALRTGRSWAYTHWPRQDDAVVRRYAQAVVSGRYRTAMAALPDCCAELAKSSLRPGRPRRAVMARLLECVRALGYQRYPRWNAAEEALYRRYLGLLIEGRYVRVRDAAWACAERMRRLRGRGHGHSATAVYTRMNHEVSELGLPRYKGEMTAGELLLIELYARAADRGEYRNWLLAAEACLEELRRQYGQAHSARQVKVRRVSGHSLHTVHERLMQTAKRLGLLGVGGRDWTDEEQKLCDGVLKWYERRRRAARPAMWRDAAEALREELQQRGYGRTVCACVSRLQTTRRQLQEARET